MYCINCGIPLDNSALFCPNCGTKVGAKTSENSTSFTQDVKNGYHNIMSGPKNKFIAGVIAILLGSMGIHNFYLGYNGKGVAQLILFVCFMGWVSQIWAIIEAIMIFTGAICCDAAGRPLTDNF